MFKRDGKKLFSKKTMYLANALDENIFYYKNVIKNPQRFINTLNNIDSDEGVRIAISEWKTWLASNGENDCFGEKKDLFYHNRDMVTGSNAKVAKDLIEELRSAIDSVCYAFVKDRGLDIDPNISPYLDVCNYHVGGQLGWHNDVQDGDMSLMYSIVLYFNDDHEGGEISFIVEKEDGTNTTFTLKPEPGSALIFPSTPPYLHRSEQIIKGNKYMSTAHIFVDGYDPNNPEHIKQYRGIDV